MSRARLDELLSSDAVASLRADGGSILICGVSGRILHADDDLAAMAGRTSLPSNAFDMIDASYTLKATALMARYVGRHIITRFPWVGDDGRAHWCRFDVSWPLGFILIGVQPEEDPERHHVHAEPVT